MREFEDDPIGAAFTAFRFHETHLLRPAGFAEVRATVRHRRRVRVIAAAVLAAIAIVVPATGYAYVSGGHYTPAPGGVSSNPSTHDAADASTSPSSATAGPSSGAPTHQLAACRAAQLAGTVTGEGSMASQPFVIIALTNTSAAGCELTGYPKISATGHAQSTPAATGPLQTTVMDGPIYERADPGPKRIELAPHGSASFALGTGTAYDGGAHLYTLTKLRVLVPGDPVGVPVSVTIAASAPAGQPIPVAVTAFVAGGTGPA